MWTTDRLEISALQMSDAAELFAALDHPEVATYLGGPDVESLEWLRARILRLLAGPPAGSAAVAWLNVVVRLRDSGRPVIGRLEATVYPRWAEVAWVLGAPYWGRGYGTEGATWLIDHLEGHLGIHEQWATADPRNEPSLRIMRRLDFHEQALPARRRPESFADGDVVLARGVDARPPLSRLP